MNANAGFRTSHDGFLGRNGEDVFELLLCHFDVCIGQVDLVDNGDDLESLFFSEVDIGHGLRFDALSCINDKQSTFTGGKGARNFVGEINVAWSVGEVQLVSLAVLRRILHRDRMRLDRDASLAL